MKTAPSKPTTEKEKPKSGTSVRYVSANPNVNWMTHMEQRVVQTPLGTEMRDTETSIEDTEGVAEDRGADSTSD